MPIFQGFPILHRRMVDVRIIKNLYEFVRLNRYPILLVVAVLLATFCTGANLAVWAAIVHPRSRAEPRAVRDLSSIPAAVSAQPFSLAFPFWVLRFHRGVAKVGPPSLCAGVFASACPWCFRWRVWAQE
jgi:hypothetical protein